MTETIICCPSCGRKAELSGTGLPPDGWVGSERAAVCPGCRDVKWCPHCTSPVDINTGADVEPPEDWEAMPPGERHFPGLMLCEYIDISVSMSIAQAEAAGQIDWRCPRCGGTMFDWAPDHLASGAGRP
jgi:hypothetical protein